MQHSLAKAVVREDRMDATPVLEVEIDKPGYLMCRFEWEAGPLVGQNASGGGSWGEAAGKTGWAQGSSAVVGEARCERGGAGDEERGGMQGANQIGWTKMLKEMMAFFVNKAGERMWWADWERGRNSNGKGGKLVRTGWWSQEGKGGWTERLTG